MSRSGISAFIQNNELLPLVPTPSEIENFPYVQFMQLFRLLPLELDQMLAI